MLLVLSCFNMLLSVLVLTLLADAVASSSGRNGEHHYELAGAGLTALYNSPVYLAERIQFVGRRTVQPHRSQVRVTLADGSRWLVHKGDRYGISSQTVVVEARHMGPDWTVLTSRNFQGTKTVSDFVRTGGSDYNLLFANCHLASLTWPGQMMNQ